MANQIIRKATSADAPALKDCINAAYEGYRKQIKDLPDVSGGIMEDILNNLVHVAEMDGKIVGGAVLVPGDTHLLLANVAMHPDAAGLGLGRALLENADREALRLGFCEMRLSTHADMPENVALYEHLGWEVTGRSGNKIFMRKRVTQ